MAEAVEIFANIGADIPGIEVGQRSEGRKGALVSRFEIGGGVEKKDALTLEDAETPAIAAEGFAADGEADLFGESEKFVKSGLEVHKKHRLRHFEKSPYWCCAVCSQLGGRCYQNSGREAGPGSAVKRDNG